MNSQMFPEMISCEICIESFDEDSRCPRILPCGHSFCHSCLGKILEQSPRCPTCKFEIDFFESAESIAVNYSLKNMILTIKNSFERYCGTDSKFVFQNVAASVVKLRSVDRKLKSEGFCHEHEYFKELRCMDCEMWVCAVCVATRHKLCNTLLLNEAYEVLKQRVYQKVEEELKVRKVIEVKLTESLAELGRKRKALVDNLKDCEKQIEKLESQKADEDEFCDKLKRLQTSVEDSSTDGEISKANNEINCMLDSWPNHLPNDYQHLHILTLRRLRDFCRRRPVYAMEDRFNDVIQYGKLDVKDGRIWVSSFRSEKPEANLYPMKDLLSRFGGSSELSKTAFLQLTPEDGAGDVVEVLIETDGVSPRAKNFLLLCSALKGLTYEGLTLKCNSSFCQLHLPHPPVVEGIREIDSGTPVMKGLVYGMNERNSWFAIQMEDSSSESRPKVGVVVAGYQLLRCLEGDWSVRDCGLVI